MGILHQRRSPQQMKLSVKKGARNCPKIPTERIIKSALMIRQSSFSKLITKKFPNGLGYCSVTYENEATSKVVSVGE